jgi:ribosomal protein S18 acetylase RimI-like enzyme
MISKIKSKDDLLIVISTPQDNDYVKAKLLESDAKAVPCTQDGPHLDMNYVIKDSSGKVIGGIIANMYCWKMLYIDSLWVDEQYRGHGYGSVLLKKVEGQAKQKGCTLSHADTFDFQAPDFYVRHGYEICGEIDNCPPGHKRLSLRKYL